MSNNPRSLLFVPGSRPDRFAKALASGADMVCLDLEDAVSPAGKAAARQTVVDFVAQLNATQRNVEEPAARLGIRINPLTSAVGVTDAAALLATDLSALAFVMLPKVEHDQLMSWAGELFPSHLSILPIIESAAGLHCSERVFAHPRVIAAIFGAVDYAADIGCDLSSAALHMPRTQLLNGAAMHEVTLLDYPFLDVPNLDGLREDLMLTRALGMRARSAIHPTQIEVIHSALAPSAEEITHAKRVIDAFEAADQGVALLDGKLLELPVVKAARRVLE